MKYCDSTIMVGIGCDPLAVKITTNPGNSGLEHIHLGADVHVSLHGDSDAILATLRNLGVAVAEAILRRSSDAALQVVAEAVKGDGALLCDNCKQPVVVAENGRYKHPRGAYRYYYCRDDEDYNGPRATVNGSRSAVPEAVTA